MKKIAINGFGRIGRLVFKIIEQDKDLEVVAINDLTDPEQIAYLLKYDTNYGNYLKDEISFDEKNLIVKGRKIRVLAEKDPSVLPWKDLGIDAVIECTGAFTDKEKAALHIKAGAKKVFISAPAKGDVKTIVYNVNHDILNGDEEIVSAASCTTNCLAPVLKVLNDQFKIKMGYMTTVHAYTNDQVILDIPHKKGIYARRGRAGATNIIPSSTGAATAIGLVIPELEGKMSGSAMRVPVSVGSVIDLVLELDKKVTVEEINQALEKNQNETLQFTMDPVVSSDVIGSDYGALVDGLLTGILEVDDKQLVKVVAWYDNEMGYSYQLVRVVKYLLNKLYR